MENKQRKSIKTVYMLIITLVLLTQVIFIRFWYSKTLDDTGFRAMAISQVVAQSINIDEYEKFLTTKKHDAYYKHMQEYFHRIQVETGVKYIYVEHKISEDKIEYIFDSEEDSLGDIDVMSTPEAHTNSESFHTDAQTSTLWGTLITGYVPLINEKGKIIGAVGTDVDIQFIYNELATRVGHIILYTLAMVILFSFLIYLTLSQEIRRRRIVEKNLKKSMISIKNLLNNAGQGFLSFGSDMRIRPEYSLECLRLLGHNIDNKTFPELIYPNEQDQRDFMEKVIIEFFQEKDIHRRGVFLSFLPNEVFLNNFHMKIDYNIIKDKHQVEAEAIMVVLTDASEKRALQEQMETERKMLKMIVNAVVNRNDLLEIILDYQNFYRETVPNLLTCQESLNTVLVEIKRRIHTFKGLFGQFEMMNIVSSLHKIEEEIKSIEHKQLVSNADLGIFLQNCNLELILKEDFDVLQSTLGEKFLVRDRIIEVQESKLIELEDQIKVNFSSEEAAILMAQIRQLRYRLFKELLSVYPTYVEGLARRLQKGLYPLELKGGDFQVDTIRYQAFAKSLIHIFANCLDHGIETREDRINAGKDERGQILCEMKMVDDQKISLRIADDGRGIDIEEIRQKACKLGMLNEEEIWKLEDKDIIPLIFEDGLSGKEGVSLFSGRGIGMAIVKKELDKIDGHLEINTRLGMGTEFIFVLPI